MPAIDPNTFALLRLTLVNGLGPVLIGRLIQAFGSAVSALEAPVAALRNIKGIGSERAARIRGDIERSHALAQRELEETGRLGATIVGIHDAAYPPLLRQIPDPPPVLYVRGTLRPDGADRYPIGIVGSRSCTLYGREQAERFAQHLGQCGLTIVSGGARGIDTSAHRAALRVQGRTIVVMGCGLSHVYPPENAELFDQIAGRGAHGGEGGDAEAAKGAIVSELPMQSAPTRENFPARNRIISGISLGVIVIEAGRRSGALITARQAVEEHGREVFALPGRVDSPASEGVLDLLKQGGAAMVTHPQDVLDALESPARHHFAGTHDAVTRDPARDDQGVFDWQTLAPALASDTGRGRTDSGPGSPRVTTSLSPRQDAILEALAEPRTIDELVQMIGGDAASLRADITVLEIRRRVARSGSRLVRSDAPKA